MAQNLLVKTKRKGNHYYSKSGHFLGVYGNESKVRVYVEPYGLFSHGSFLKKVLNEKDVIDNSVCFSSVPDIARLTIIQKIANTIGLYNVLISYVPAKITSGQIKTEDSGYLDHKTGKIQINPNSKFIKKGDYYNILLTLYHEKYHYENHYKKGLRESKRNEIEYDTYKYIYNHHLFYESTLEYQSVVISQMRDYALKIGKQPEF